MNCIIYQHGSNKIKYFLEDCINKDRDFIGLNCKLYGVKPIHWAVKWTNDIVNPINDEDGKQISWDKTVDQVNETQEKTEIKKITNEEYREAIKFRQKLADLKFNQIDAYIDNNVVSFEEAKDYLKQLSKVVLGIIKMIDRD